jgi:hypothetical protein
MSVSIPHKDKIKIGKTFPSQRFSHNFCQHRIQSTSFPQVKRHSLPGWFANFSFETMPDGLPPSEIDASQDVPSLCKSIMSNFLTPF